MNLKKMFLTCLAIGTALTGAAGQNAPDVPENTKIVKAAFGDAPAEVRSDFYSIPEGKAVPPSSFSVKCDMTGITFSIRFASADGSPIPDTRNALEFYFQPMELEHPLQYYQFYGILRNEAPCPESIRGSLTDLGIPWNPSRDIAPCYYYYQAPPEQFPYLRHYQVQTVYQKDAVDITIFIPWCEFVTVLPFDENGKGKAWRFNVARAIGNDLFTWQGNLHRHKTWGLLQFSDLTADQVKALYRNAILQICDAGPWLPRWNFKRSSIPAGREKLSAELKQRKAQIPADPAALSVKEWKDLAVDTRYVAGGRRHIVSWNSREKEPEKSGWTKSYNKAEKKLTWTYTFTKPVTNGWFSDVELHAHRNKEVGTVEIELDGKKAPAGARHWQFGAAKAGSVLRITYSNTVSNGIGDICDLYGGLLPVDPSIRDSRTALEPFPTRGGGIPTPAFICHHTENSLTILRKRPKVIWYGGAMLNGLGFRKSLIEFDKKYGSINCGTVNDGGQQRKTLWRIGNSVIDEVKPEYIVFQTDVSKGAVPVVEEIFKLIHKMSPDTKIIAISCMPGKRNAAIRKPDEEYIVFNEEMKAVAGKLKDYVRYIDLSGDFYDKDGRLKTELIATHSIYYADCIYQHWCDAVAEIIESDRKNAK